MDCKQTHTQINKNDVKEVHNKDERIDSEMQRLWHYNGSSNQRTMEITEMQQMRLI